MPDDHHRHRPRRGPKGQPPPHSAPQRRRTDLRIVPAGPGQWKLQYPPCVAERMEDLAEVEQMVALARQLLLLGSQRPRRIEIRDRGRD